MTLRVPKLRQAALTRAGRVGPGNSVATLSGTHPHGAAARQSAQPNAFPTGTTESVTTATTDSSGPQRLIKGV